MVPRRVILPVTAPPETGVLPQNLVCLIITVTLIAVIADLRFTQQIMAAVVLPVPRFCRAHRLFLAVNFPAFRSPQSVIPGPQRQAPSLRAADFTVQVITTEFSEQPVVQADTQCMSAAIVQRFQMAAIR